MFSPAPSNISQNDAEVLEIQWRHEEQQQLLVQLEEAANSCQAEHAAQKTRKEAEVKVMKKAERRKVAEEKNVGVPPTTPG